MWTRSRSDCVVELSSERELELSREGIHLAHVHGSEASRALCRLLPSLVHVVSNGRVVEAAVEFPHLLHVCFAAGYGHHVDQI